MDYKKAKRTLLWFRACVILSVLLALCGASCFVAESMCRTEAYNSFTGISIATDLQTRKNYYLRAMELCPEEPSAYLLLLDTYNADSTFDRAESQEFLAIYNRNHSKLRVSAENYAELHYKAGLMYVNGYADSDTTRLRMALPFLETANEHISEADPYRQTVACYCAIGEYYNTYIWNASNIAEVSEATMRQLMQQLQSTMVALSHDTSGNAIANRLGFSIAALNLLYDQRDIFAITIERDDVESFLDLVYSDLPAEQSLQQAQTKLLLQSLLENRETYADMLGRAYDRLGVEE